MKRQRDKALGVAVVVFVATAWVCRELAGLGSSAAIMGAAVVGSTLAAGGWKKWQDDRAKRRALIREYRRLGLTNLTDED